MNVEEITKRAAEGALKPADVDRLCEQEQMNFADFSDRVARHVATEYHHRRLDFVLGGAAMNQLLGLASLPAPREWLGDFAFSVFLAFDAGEYHPDTPHLSADEVTVQLIGPLLDASTNA